MYLRLLIISALISLSRAAADTTGWEIINGDKPWDDKWNTESLLSEEHLLPYKPQQKSDVRTVIGRPKPQEHSKTNVLPVKEATKIVRNIKTQEMSHGTQRHLLQLDHKGLVQSQSSIHKRQSVQSPDVKVTLSRPCKQNDEDDCLYDVEDVAKVVFENENDEGLNPLDETNDNDDGDDVSAHHVSRHKRQVTEASGTEGLYNPDEENALKGTYEYSPDKELPVLYNGSSTELTSAELQTVKDEITKSFNNTPGFLKVVIKGTRIVNHKLLINFTLVFDGQSAASNSNSQSVEEAVITGLNKTSIPNFYNMTIFGMPIDAASFLRQEDFFNGLSKIFYAYCKTVKDPCGPEYDDSTCISTAFMAGSCKHKCANYGPCSNNAECELDKNYKPFCNCGQRYEGPLCQYKKEAKKSLSEPETVGVALGAGLVALGLLSCCIFVFFCRKSHKNVKFTYYQDEEQLDRTSSDPTIPDYYIDRPQVSREPIRIFEPNLGFEA